MPPKKFRHLWHFEVKEDNTPQLGHDGDGWMAKVVEASIL